MAIILCLAKKYSGSTHPNTIEAEAKAWQLSFGAVAQVEMPLLTLRIGDSKSDPASELGWYCLKRIPSWNDGQLAKAGAVSENRCS
jgi:hypothetical protein